MKEEKNVVMMIADISGYTRFMLNNSKTLNHAQAIITALMSAVIDEAKIPLKIAKLEGDAVFLYLAEGREWTQDKKSVWEKLGRIHHEFTKRLAELKVTNTCGCDACMNINTLTIKLIVHAGKALFYKIDGLSELAGPDVIIVHRLLKNHVDSKEYILITRSAFAALEMEPSPEYLESVEPYDDVGDIPVMVRTDMSGSTFQPSAKFVKSHEGIFGRMAGKRVRMMAKVQMRGRKFTHLG